MRLSTPTPTVVDFFMSLFLVYFRLFKQTTNICEKMSIQFSVLGFEPTTFST